MDRAGEPTDGELYRHLRRRHEHRWRQKRYGAGVASPRIAWASNSGQPSSMSAADSATGRATGGWFPWLGHRHPCGAQEPLPEGLALGEPQGRNLQRRSDPGLPAVAGGFTRIMARSAHVSRNWKATPSSRSSLPIPTLPGNGARTKIPMVSCDSISNQEELISAKSRKTNYTGRSGVSITDPESV